MTGFQEVGSIFGFCGLDEIFVANASTKLHPGDVLCFVGACGPREGFAQVARVSPEDDFVQLKTNAPRGVTMKDVVHVARAMGEKAFKVRG